MSFVGFVVFYILALIYLWKGNDRFDSKAWSKLGAMFVFIVIGIFAGGFIINGLSAMFSGFSNNGALNVLMRVAGSLIFALVLKGIVAALYKIFGGVMTFHKEHNTANNYQKLSSLGNGFGPLLLVGVKVLISVAGILIYYGIWYGADLK